ncbi:MAG: insulinase family protein [Deltaproteobacteria bacterium]|nr:insulinase family protein [Deltaproteobacteria bacterium]
MTTVLVETSRAIPLVSMAVTFRAGAVHDPADRPGLARLTARMLRRGYEGQTAEEIEQAIDRLGGSVSAHVGLGISSVGCEVLVRSAEPMAALMGRLLTTPTFDATELEKLKRQAHAEIVNSRDNDAVLAARGLRRHFFAGHPHGRRIAGSTKGIATATEADVRTFHQRHYQRANALVAISGDVTAHQAEALAERLLAGLPVGERTPYPTGPPTPPEGRNLVVIDKPDRTQSQLVIGTMGTHTKDDDHVALVVANAAFGGTFTSRLTNEVRSKRGWSYGASSHLPSGQLREAFTMWTAPGADTAADCLSLELDLLAKWRDRGIDAAELAKCQQYLRLSHAFEIDTPKKRLGQKIERDLLDLPEDFHRRWVERVNGVTLDEANQAVRRRISDSALWVSAVATNDAIGDTLRAAIPDLHQTVVEPFDIE